MSAEGNAGRFQASILRVFIWLIWTGFLLFCVGAVFFAVAIKRDVYFVRHYEHFPMGTLTVIMTSHPIWIAVLPFLALPAIISYQRRRNPGVGGLLVLAASALVVSLTVAILLVCSGPGIQM